MKSAFCLVRRGTQFYAHRRITQQRETLHTSHRQQAEKLLAAMNDAERAPHHDSLALGRVFLSARDAELPGRVWGTLMEAIIHHGRDSTLLRYAHEMKDPIIVRLKARGLIETNTNRWTARL
jgi:hypothetical protein